MWSSVTARVTLRQLELAEYRVFFSQKTVSNMPECVNDFHLNDNDFINMK